MPAPYLLTCPLRSPIWTVGPTGAAGSGAPANSPLLPLESAEHRLQASAISPICFA